MRKSSLVSRVIMVLVVGVLVVGCGFYKKRTTNKAIEKVERESVAQAGQQGTQLYATEMHKAMTDALTLARRNVEEGEYDKAMEQVRKVEEFAGKAIVEARKNKKEAADALAEIETVLADATSKIEKSKAANAPGIDAARIEAVEADIDAVRKAVEGKKVAAGQNAKAYAALISSATTVAGDASQIYDQVLEGEALKMVERIDVLRKKALSLSPEEYVPEDTKKAVAGWTSFDSSIQTRKYADAIETGKGLEVFLPEFIANAGMARARKAIDRAKSEREVAQQQGASVYALDTLRKSESAYSEAEKLFEEKEYDGAFESANEAVREATAAVVEVENEAAKAIDLVKEKVEEAENEGAAEHAGDLLREAKQYRGDAALAFERKAFFESLRAADKALEQAGAATITTRKKKAELVLVKTQRAIAHAVEQDAAKYAPSEFIDAKTTYDRAVLAYNDGDFAGVHTLSKEAADKAELVRIKMEETTLGYIKSAENMIELARVAKSPQLVQSDFEASVDTLAVSREKLGEGSYKAAIEKAREAEERALGAKSEAYRMRSESEQISAREEIASASRAGAASYAPTLLGGALDSLTNSEKDYRSGSYESSLTYAGEAVDMAVRARTKLVDEAQGAVDSARTALAASYVKEKFFDSEGNLLEAKEAMKRKDYAVANQRARYAADTARAAEKETWKARSEEKIAYLKGESDKIMAQDALRRIPEELNTARLLLVEAVGSMGQGNYPDTYVRAETAEGAVSVAWARLREVAEREINDLEAKSSDLDTLALDQVGRTERSAIFPMIAKARSAFESEQYKTVFDTIDAGKAAGAQAETRIKQHNVETKKKGIEDLLLQYRANGIEALAPVLHADLSARTASVDPLAASSDGYEETMAKLDGYEAEALDLPKRADESVDGILDFTKRTLTEARTAGAMEHIRREYEDSVNVYKDALGYPRQENYTELARLVHGASEAAVASLNRTMVAIDEGDYRQTVKEYLLQVNALLGRWPFANKTGTGKVAIEVVLASRSTEDVDVYRELQRDLKSMEFKTQSADLYSAILDIKPPASMNNVHREVVAAFRTAAEAADLFNRYGLYDQYPLNERVDYLRKAYDKIGEMEDYSIRIEAMLQGVMVREESTWDVFKSDRGLDIRNYMWTTYGN